MNDMTSVYASIVYINNNEHIKQIQIQRRLSPTKKRCFMAPCLIKISAKNPSKTDGKDGIPSRGVARALKTSTAACSSMWNLLSERSAFTCKHDSEMIHTDYVGGRTTLQQQSLAMCQPTHVPRLRVNRKEGPCADDGSF